VGVRAWWLLLVAGVLRLALPRLSPWPEAASVRVSVAAGALLAGAFCGANWRGRTAGSRAGLLLVAAGAAANAVPTLWSGAMPFSAGQALAAGLSTSEVAGPRFGHVALSGEPGPIAALSDVIAIPLAQSVASVGDLCLLVGSVALFSSVLPRRSGRCRAPYPTCTHRVSVDAVAANHRRR
jgi:hypothetical protein